MTIGPAPHPGDLGLEPTQDDRLEPSREALLAYKELVEQSMFREQVTRLVRNNLDALCQRYMVDNSQRDLHGALLDAEILADVYLAMTGGQRALSLNTEGDMDDGHGHRVQRRAVDRSQLNLVVVRAGEKDLVAHEARLDAIAEATGETPVWRRH